MSTNFAKTLVWKQDYDVIFVTSQTAHTKYKWLPYAAEWNPPHEKFLRTPLCYANVANSLMCYINLKYIWANYVLLKPGVYTPTLKKHQVVRDLKKFENHCSSESVAFCASYRTCSYFLRQWVEPPVRFHFRWGRMKLIGACCCAIVICSTARSRAFTLHILLTFSAAVDHTDGLHSRLDHCMHSECMHKL